MSSLFFFLSPDNFQTEVLYSWRPIDRNTVVLRTCGRMDLTCLKRSDYAFNKKLLALLGLWPTARSKFRIALFYVHFVSYLLFQVIVTDFLLKILWNILRIFWTVIFLNVLFQQLYCNGKILSSPTANFHFALLKIFQWMRFDILIFSLLLNSDCSIRTCDDETGVRS